MPEKSNKVVDYEAQAVAYSAHSANEQGVATGGTSMFAKVALMCGLLNALLVGALAYEVRKLVPVAVFVSTHQKQLDDVLSLTSYVSDISIARLFHGSLPQLVNDLLTSDVSGAAIMTQNFANDVHQATCAASYDKTDYKSKPNYYISKYASLVNYLATQVGNINSLNPADDKGGRDDDPSPVQVTGEGGMVFETLKYTIDFVKSQTDPVLWKDASCSCKAFVNQLSSVKFSGNYGPDCASTEFDFDVQSKAYQYINALYTTCGSLCDGLPTDDNPLVGEASV